jgi:rare lipoprotein A
MPVESTSYTSSSVYQIGKASFYGGYFNGRKTANGEIFNENKLTAAHRTLPFGTVLKVTRLDNHQSVIVTVNDRGPYVGNRVLDLSKSAAREIGMVDKGVAEVVIETISMGRPSKYPNSEPFAMIQPAKPAHKTKKKEVKDDPRKGLIPEEYAAYSEENLSASRNKKEVPELEIADGIILEGTDRTGAFKQYSQNAENTTNEAQNVSFVVNTTPETTSYTQNVVEENIVEQLAQVQEALSAQNDAITATSNYVNPISYKGGSKEEGIVLPYNSDFEGKATASGEVYYGWDYTIGHSTYPFGTMLLVKRKSNGYSVIVKVNDRVGSASQPIFYLSKAAAESLELTEGGADVVAEPITLEEIASMTVYSATSESAVSQVNTAENSAYQPQEVVQAVEQTAQKHDAYAATEDFTEGTVTHFSSENIDNEGFGLKIASFTDVKNALQALEQIANRGYDKLLVQSDIANNEVNFHVFAGPFSSKDEAMYYKSQLAGAKISSNVVFLEPLR